MCGCPGAWQALSAGWTGTTREQQAGAAASDFLCFTWTPFEFEFYVKLVAERSVCCCSPWRHTGVCSLIVLQFCCRGLRGHCCRLPNTQRGCLPVFGASAVRCLRCCLSFFLERLLIVVAACGGGCLLSSTCQTVAVLGALPEGHCNPACHCIMSSKHALLAAVLDYCKIG